MAEPAAEGASEAGPKKKGKKLLIIGAAVLILALGGGAGWYFSRPKHGEGKEEHAKKEEPKKNPIFVPLEHFTVNLSDDDADRYAQIGITLLIYESEDNEKLKNMMPVVRNSILMLLSSRTSTELLTREGKEKLAQDIARETGRAIGWEPPKKAEPVKKEAAEKEKEPKAEATEQDKDKEAKPAEAEKPAGKPNPISAVHFSEFIIQ